MGEEAVAEIKVATFSLIYELLNPHPTSITLLGKSPAMGIQQKSRGRGVSALKVTEDITYLRLFFLRKVVRGKTHIS